VVGGKARDLQEGLERANDSMDSGGAMRVLESLVALSNSFRL